MRALLAAGIMLFVSGSFAAGEEVAACSGSPTGGVREGIYNFITTSTTEDQKDFKFVLTCVENRVNGLLRFRWHIPGHRVDLLTATADLRRRPVAKEMQLNSMPGCFAYGNLSDKGTANFYGDTEQQQRVESEKKEGCQKNVSGFGAPSITRFVANERILPGIVKYDEQVSFLYSDADKELTRIKFSISLERQRNNAKLILRVSVDSSRPAGSEPTRTVVFRPIGGSSASHALAQMVGEFMIDGNADQKGYREGRRVIDQYGDMFGSAELGIYNQSKELVSSIWIPVFYNLNEGPKKSAAN